MKFWQIVSGAVLAMVLVGCNSNSRIDNNAGAQALAVTGTVSYRDRSALPENAVVTVVLADAALQDAPMRILSQVSFPAAGKQVPFSFALPYAQSQIMNGSRVIVTARIDLDGRLMYTSTRLYEVVTNGNNMVDVQLDRVGS